MTKICYICKKDLPVANFYTHWEYGHQSQCKDCQSAREYELRANRHKPDSVYDCFTEITHHEEGRLDIGLELLYPDEEILPSYYIEEQ